MRNCRLKSLTLADKNTKALALWFRVLHGVLRLNITSSIALLGVGLSCGSGLLQFVSRGRPSVHS